ncbi:hypothetical protein [Paenibacillus sp. NFR01]|uniref:sialidase family protein n=1 Tax=Paenibacillus sp. NFR01 TaxID=1566279 RepID=UPI0008C9CCCC|nr:hypothetical protein [Paenibacillus sp. NFR01]SEU31994.1 hypothetical protein SAMN03159358_0086 [Paenibacillus sp. NFR01]
MKRTPHWQRKAIAFLLAGLLLLAVPGFNRTASAAAPVCGSGDHGLLPELQVKNAASGATMAFSDIEFLNADTGRAAGNGFMIGTSDGGCQFQKIYEGQWNFRDIDFPNNVHGWALASVQDGQQVYLIATADGGATWKRLGSGAVTFERIDFLDNTHGFGYNRASTYYTADGGVTWTRVATPANTRGAEFTSRQNGWAVVVQPGASYKVMKTANGGKSWSLSLTASFAYPEFGRVYASGKQVYALLYGGTGMSQTSYSLYASANQGKTWTRVIAESTAGGGPAPGSGALQHDKGPAKGKPGNMQLVGDASAFLVGYSPAGGEVAVGRSLNAGKTWTNLPPVPGYEGIISFPDSTKGWMAVRGLNGEAILYATSDGGSSWQAKLTFKGNSR